MHYSLGNNAFWEVEECGTSTLESGGSPRSTKIMHFGRGRTLARERCTFTKVEYTTASWPVTSLGHFFDSGSCLAYIYAAKPRQTAAGVEFPRQAKMCSPQLFGVHLETIVKQLREAAFCLMWKFDPCSCLARFCAINRRQAAARSKKVSNFGSPASWRSWTLPS